MIPIPKPEDYDVSSENGFLSAQPPLECLPDSYYEPWEYVVKNLQGLMLSKRLREVVDRMPVLSTDRLFGEAQWRRAYSALAFITHAYIWGGDKPMEWIPPSVTVPFKSACAHLELPMVATYAGLVLWNWKPIFDTERVDTLLNLDMIDTFTGSMDEKWFYLISVAIEARGAPLIPLMLHAIQAAIRGERDTVTNCLRSFAERLDELGAMLVQMYDNCDPHVFYHRIRPYLAGSKNMADAGLPNGVVFDDGGAMNKQRWVQFSGGSNAQSSLIQFFDVVLNVKHRPTGTRSSSTVDHEDGSNRKKPGKPDFSFHQEMRQYMPGPHARFLEAVARVTNIRAFVEAHSYDRPLAIAFDACLAMLSAFRDKHIQLVSRYIIIKSREAKTASSKQQPDKPAQPHELALRPKQEHLPNTTGAEKPAEARRKKDLKGTGGTSLIPFLRQARDETGEPAVDAWARRLLSKSGRAGAKKEDVEWEAGREMEVQGISSVWRVGESDGGLCAV